MGLGPIQQTEFILRLALLNPAGFDSREAAGQLRVPDALGSVFAETQRGLFDTSPQHSITVPRTALATALDEWCERPGRIALLPAGASGPFVTDQALYRALANSVTAVDEWLGEVEGTFPSLAQLMTWSGQQIQDRQATWQRIRVVLNGVMNAFPDVYCQSCIA